MIADISRGHTGAADWLFLIGAILAFIAGVLYLPKTQPSKLTIYAASLVALALCLVALGFLVL